MEDKQTIPAEEWLEKNGYPLTMPMTRDNLAIIINRYNHENAASIQGEWQADTEEYNKMLVEILLEMEYGEKAIPIEERIVAVYNRHPNVMETIISEYQNSDNIKDKEIDRLKGLIKDLYLFHRCDHVNDESFQQFKSENNL